MDKGLNIATRYGQVGIALALANTPHRAAKILQRYAAQCISCDTSPDKLAENLGQAFKFSVDWKGTEKCLRWSENNGNHLILRGEGNFPRLLNSIPDAPNLLFVKGQPNLLNQAQVAMVGSRKATHYGLANARDVADALSRAGFIVTSGLALGIDGQSHSAALASGAKTIAVLGAGIERCYPRRHQDLFREIEQNGALVSEFPIDSSPKPYHFPRRNRIISGLSIGVIVVEANIRSGSLTTANHAAIQGREVFAIPGSIRNPSASGCHKLIVDGAQLVESIDELLKALWEVVPLYDPQFQLSARTTDAKRTGSNVAEGSEPNGINDSERKVLSLMGGLQIGFDELQLISGLTTSELSSILSALELHGLVKQSAGNTYTPIR